MVAVYRQVCQTFRAAGAAHGGGGDAAVSARTPWLLPSRLEGASTGRKSKRHAGPPACAAADTVVARDTPQRGASRKDGVSRRREADCGARHGKRVALHAYREHEDVRRYGA